MTNLENFKSMDTNEKLSEKKFFSAIENDFNTLNTKIQTENLKKGIEKGKEPEPAPGEFLKYKETSQNGDYVIYKYKIKKGGTPEGVRAQAVAQGIATSKKGIQITKGGVDPYPENHHFRAKEVVFVRIPTEPGKFMSMGETKDHNFNKYSYRIKKGGTPESVRAQAVAQGIATSKKGIQITNGAVDPYPENHKFKANEVVYVRVPKKNNTPNTQPNNPSNTPNTPNTPNNQPNKPSNNSENNKIETGVEGMRCKGGEYFGIDVSRHNMADGIVKKGTDESEASYKIRRDKYWSDRFEEFKKTNRDKWDSDDKDKRGISFMYIRVSAGDTANADLDARALEEWVNIIYKYNNDQTVKTNKEQIAGGLYWTLSEKSGNTGQSEAKKFMEKYNKYKGKLGENQLVPMLDLEDTMFKTNKQVDKVKIAKTKKRALEWLKYVEEKTGIIPGIYISATSYGDFIKTDPEFNKYKTVWVAAYSPERIDAKEGTVKVGSNKEKIKPAMYQSSETGRFAGTGNSKGYTDMDHTKNIGLLLSKNNKSTETTKSSKSIQSKKKKTK